MQAYLWPSEFQNYLHAVGLQFSYNRDFGSSPAGLFGWVLSNAGIPYSPASTIFYLLYAIPLFGLLVYLAHRFLEGKFSLEQWIPLMLPGVVLLNPRIMEYDMAPLTLPMTFIVWRFLTSSMTSGRALILFSVLFLIANSVAAINQDLWKLIACILLIGIFTAGGWNLLRQNR